MGSCIAPSGINGETHAGPEKDLPGAHDPPRPETDGEKFTARVAQQKKTNHEHLGCGLGLARRIGGEHGAVAKGQLTQSGDEKIAGDKDDGGPCRDVMRPGQTDQCGGDEDFVGQRIHEAPEVGFTAEPAGQDAVEVIAEDGEPEGKGGHGGTPRHAAFACYDKHTGQKKAQDGELVGESHGSETKMTNGGARDKEPWFAVADRKRGRKWVRRFRFLDHGESFFERSFEGTVQYPTILEIRPAGEPRKKL